MFKFCLGLVCSLFLTGVSYAQEAPVAEFDKSTLPIIDETDSFVSEDEKLGSIQLISAPTCDNEILNKKALEKIKEYSLAQTTGSIISKRKHALILSDIKDFEEISAKNFTPKDDFNTANALITIKINKHIKDKDFVVCRQKTAKEKPLYLVIYPYLDNYMVHIINLEQYSDDYEKVSFTYPWFWTKKVLNKYGNNKKVRIWVRIKI